MRDKQRKKAQSFINHTIRDMNKNLAEDNLWRGRFYAHQVDANWDRFDDGSGGILSVWVEARDKKTGVYYGFRINNYYPGWTLWEEMNKFIVEYSHVWDNIDLVKDDKIKWEKIKWVPVKELFR